MKLGIFIGRMQPIHLGHQKIIEKSLEENNLTFIILGSSGVQDQSNIFTDKQRDSFLKVFLRKKTKNRVLFLKDSRSDEKWFQNLDRLIEDNGNKYLEKSFQKIMGNRKIPLCNDDIQFTPQCFKNIVTQVTFYGGDLEKDYAIQVIKKYETYLSYKRVIYSEVNRNELIIHYDGEEILLSSTRIREELKKKNYKLIKMMVDKNITKEIFI